MGLQIQNKDLAAQLATESEGRATARDAAIAADQRANELTTVNDEQRVALESADRARKAAEHDKLEATDRLADIQDMYNKAATAKRNAENDFHTLQSEVDEIENGEKAARPVPRSPNSSPNSPTYRTAPAAPRRRVPPSPNRTTTSRRDWKKPNPAAAAPS